MKKTLLSLFLFVGLISNSFSYNNTLSRCSNGKLYIYYKNLESNENNWFLVKNFKCDQDTQFRTDCDSSGLFTVYDALDNPYPMPSIKCNQFKINYPNSNIIF